MKKNSRKKTKDIFKNNNEINNSIKTINNKNKFLYNNMDIIFVSAYKKKFKMILILVISIIKIFM